MNEPPWLSAHPYRSQPWKSIYVGQRLLTTLLLVPIWAIYYSIYPKPRPSWSLRQLIFVKFTRRVYKVTEVAAVTWSTRDPEKACSDNELRETRFEWAPALSKEVTTGVVSSLTVTPKPVGAFIWPKQKPELKEGTIPIIGMFMHGGGYCHMSAHESTRPSRIPRRLMQDGHCHEIYSVEYRLLTHTPFPAVIQDAASVYAHIIDKYGPKCKTILIGDSSGGNLVLSVTRWIRDEGHYPMPAGLLLLSPSCDISHAFPLSPSAYNPRPHGDTDYLVDTPEPRALLQRTFLGFPFRPQMINGVICHCPEEEEEARLMRAVHSEYVSPASPVVLERWGHSVKIAASESAASLLMKPPSVQILEVQDAFPSPARKFDRLFGEFPRCLVVCGDAERLEREVKNLVSAMSSDGVDVTTKWVKDAVHDILIIAEGWWDERAREEVYTSIKQWMKDV